MTSPLHCVCHKHKAAWSQALAPWHFCVLILKVLLDSQLQCVRDFARNCDRNLPDPDWQILALEPRNSLELVSCKQEYVRFFFSFFFYWFLSSNRADGVGLQKSKLMKTKMVACQPVFASISKEEHKHCLRELLFPSKTNELLKCHGSAILLIYIKGVLLVNLKWSVINEKWFLLPVLELGCGVHCAGFWGTESFLKEKKKGIPSLSFPRVFQEAYPAQPADVQSPYLGHLLNTFTDEDEKRWGKYSSPFLSWHSSFSGLLLSSLPGCPHCYFIATTHKLLLLESESKVCCLDCEGAYNLWRKYFLFLKI